MQKDLTHLDIYTIDPENCTDADDGFSIVDNGATIDLYIHIADPTRYFSPHDPVFDHIMSRGSTEYFIDKDPIHMFPWSILNKATLITNPQGSNWSGESFKNAITVHTTFDRTCNTISSKVVLAKINCDPRLRFSYEQAANIIDVDIVLQRGLELSNKLYKERGGILGQLCTAYPVRTIGDSSKLGVQSTPSRSSQKAEGFPSKEMRSISENAPRYELRIDTQRVRDTKGMIAEFAIHANTVVAGYIYDNAPEYIFLRSCDATLLRDQCGKSPRELLADIIGSGINAIYGTVLKPHDLVGSALYTHFTSPLRRASDCLVHFMIRAIYTKAVMPFTVKELETYSNTLNVKYKQARKSQLTETKTRTLEAINELLMEREQIKIVYKYLTFTGLFINFSIEEIDEYSVMIPYTLRNNSFDEKSFENGKRYELIITEMHLGQKYDQGIFPELDSLFL